MAEVIGQGPQALAKDRRPWPRTTDPWQRIPCTTICVHGMIVSPWPRRAGPWPRPAGHGPRTTGPWPRRGQCMPVRGQCPSVLGQGVLVRGQGLSTHGHGLPIRDHGVMCATKVRGPWPLRVGPWQRHAGQWSRHAVHGREPPTCGHCMSERANRSWSRGAGPWPRTPRSRGRVTRHGGH
jgi:hypothetical protein